MKTILVLTDFTKNALKAAETAAMLAVELNANLLLFKCGVPVAAIPKDQYTSFLSDGILWEPGNENLIKSVSAHLRDMTAAILPKGRRLVVKHLVKEGDLAVNVNDILQKGNIEMIVMGGRTDGNTDHFLFDRDTNEVLNHVNCPVLVIPPNWPVARLRNVVFATNFNRSDIDALKYLIKLAAKFKFKLEIVHVKLCDKANEAKNEKVMDFVKQLTETNHQSVIYQEAKGNNVVDRVDIQCRQLSADLLAFSHEHTSFFSRMANGGKMRKSLANQKLPMMVLPDSKVFSTIHPT